MTGKLPLSTASKQIVHSDRGNLPTSSLHVTFDHVVRQAVFLEDSNDPIYEQAPRALADERGQYAQVRRLPKPMPALERAMLLEEDARAQREKQVQHARCRNRLANWHDHTIKSIPDEVMKSINTNCSLQSIKTQSSPPTR